MIVATAVGGMVYALLGGQPLVLLGGTGPILIFTALLYRLTSQLNLPFLPCYAWVGLWSAGFILLLALTDASVLLRYVTRFTDEVFVLLMAGIFIDEAVRKLVQEFKDDLTLTYASALSGVVLAAGTMVIALALRQLDASLGRLVDAQQAAVRTHQPDAVENATRAIEEALRSAPARDAG